MTQKKTRTLSLLAAITADVIFGMSFMFSKLALGVAAPTVLLAFRFTVAVAAMTLVVLVNALVGKLRGRPLFAFSLRGKPVYKLLLLGIVQPVAYFIFENYGILYTSSAVAGTIISAVPVCCILMDVLVLHERVTLKQVLCAVGAIGGRGADLRGRRGDGFRAGHAVPAADHAQRHAVLRHQPRRGQALYAL